ncbi:1784_t:CDS:1, partial [Ambispora gerdemannii]
SDKIEKENLAIDLKRIRIQKRKQKNLTLQNIQTTLFGEEIASNLFDYIVNN